MLLSLPSPSLLGQGKNLTIYEEINIYRVLNGLDPLIIDQRLVKAAEIQVEWLNILDTGHQTSTYWLLEAHPELDWYKLYATFGPILPEWIGPFDRARLCGFNALASENLYLGRNVKDSVIMIGWKRSFGHNSNLLNPDWVYMGYSFGPTGANFAGSCMFGATE